MAGQEGRQRREGQVGNGFPCWLRKMDFPSQSSGKTVSNLPRPSLPPLRQRPLFSLSRPPPPPPPREKILKNIFWL